MFGFLVKIENHFQFPFNGFPEMEWIQGTEGLSKTLLSLGGHVRARQQAFRRSLRFPVPATYFGVDPFLTFEFQRGTKEILELAPLVGIKAVERFHQIRITEPIIAQ